MRDVISDHGGLGREIKSITGGQKSSCISTTRSATRLAIVSIVSNARCKTPVRKREVKVVRETRSRRWATVGGRRADISSLSGPAGVIDAHITAIIVTHGSYGTQETSIILGYIR